MKKTIIILSAFLGSLVSLSSHSYEVDGQPFGNSFDLPAYLGVAWGTGFNNDLAHFRTNYGPHEQTFYAPKGDVSFTIDSVDFFSENGINPNVNASIIIDGKTIDWDHTDNFGGAKGDGFFHGTSTITFDEGGRHTINIAFDIPNEPSAGWLVFGAARGDIAPVLEGSIPPVPEPSTYAMLIAGLLVVGFTLRKQSKSDLV